MTLLRAEGISLRFGGVQALDSVTIEVNAGELVGLVGPNGAGKSLLIDVISGLQRPLSGRVLLEERDITAAPAHWRAANGVTRTFQEGRAFTSLPAGLNVAAAAAARPRSRGPEDIRFGAGRRRALDRAREVLEITGAAHLWSRSIPGLTAAEARRVEIARALAPGPRVILLDEPAAGLGDEAIGLRALLLALRDRLGLGILLVEHDPGLVFGQCDFVYALEAGRVLTSGPPAEVRRDARVRRSYLGVA